MIKNQVNFIEEEKFKKKNIVRLTYLGILIVWILSYYLIINVEKKYSDAYIFFAFGLIFTFVSLIAVWQIPNNRDKIIKFYKLGMLALCLYSALIDVLLFAGSLGNDEGNSMMILRNIGFYSRIVVPIGLITWQAKQFGFLTGVKKTKEKTIAHLKNHGNDGLS